MVPRAAGSLLKNTAVRTRSIDYMYLLVARFMQERVVPAGFDGPGPRGGLVKVSGPGVASGGAC
jgi:hypothetical protein